MAITHSFSLVWSERDCEFVGTCAQFPSLSFLSTDILAALDGIQALVKEEEALMMKENVTRTEPTNGRGTD